MFVDLCFGSEKGVLKEGCVLFDRHFALLDGFELDQIVVGSVGVLILSPKGSNEGWCSPWFVVRLSGWEAVEPLSGRTNQFCTEKYDLVVRGKIGDFHNFVPVADP